MMRRYLIYWDNNRGIDGNVIMSFDTNTSLQTLISQIMESLNEEANIGNITIKFMVELR